MNYHYPEETTAIERIKTFLIIVPGFLVFISYLYLSIYYSYFDVNIFNYITVNTIISYSIKSIGIIAIITITGYLILLLYDYLLDKVFQFIFSMIKKFSLFDRKSILILLLFLGALIVMSIMYSLQIYLVDLIFVDFTNNTLATIAITLFLFSALSMIPFGADKVTFKPNVHSFKTISIIVVLVTCILTISKASLDATSILTDEKYQYVLGSDLKGSYSDIKFKIVGKADEFYLLKYPKKEGVLFKKYNDFKNLHLRTSDQKR